MSCDNHRGEELLALTSSPEKRKGDIEPQSTCGRRCSTIAEPVFNVTRAVYSTVTTYSVEVSLLTQGSFQFLVQPIHLSGGGTPLAQSRLDQVTFNSQFG